MNTLTDGEELAILSRIHQVKHNCKYELYTSYEPLSIQDVKFEVNNITIVACKNGNIYVNGYMLKHNDPSIFHFLETKENVRNDSLWEKHTQLSINKIRKNFQLS